MEIPRPAPWLTELLSDLHRQIRAAVRSDLRSQSEAFLSSVARAGAGDISFQIDVRPEEIVEERLRNPPEPLIVICEGLGRRVFPAGASERQAAWCVIIDPLDGSREIAYGKRSAWVLSGVAAAHPAPTLADIVWAIQTEVPPLPQALGVVVEAERRVGVRQSTWDLSVGHPAKDHSLSVESSLHPSTADSIRGGFAVFADYFAGSHALTGMIADDVLARVLGPIARGEAAVFNDQYLSSAGCMYLLATGKYRFFADLRPTIDWKLAESGKTIGLCAHPYDLCTYLIAVEAGAIVTDVQGEELHYPLSTDIDCEWIGYANKNIMAEVRSSLSAVLADLADR